MTTNKDSLPSGDVPSVGGDSSVRAGSVWGDALPARTWRIEMPAGQELLNANHRPHWAVKARITRQLRNDGHLMAKHAKIPPLERAHVTCVYEPPATRAVHDEHNLYPSAKALVDGALVDSGVLTDDSHTYLVGPDMRRGPVHPGGRLVLIVTELPAQETPS